MIFDGRQEEWQNRTLFLNTGTIGTEPYTQIDIRRICFGKSVRLDAEGYEGGIWLLWRDYLVEIDSSLSFPLSYYFIKRKASEDWSFTES